MPNRRTLHHSLSLQGEGVRTGRNLTVTLEPAAEGAGLTLTRADTGGHWPVDLASTFPLPGCTAVGSPEHHVAYLEHFLAACGHLGLTDLRLTVDGPELPLLDGSARPWLEAFAEAGLREGASPLLPLTLSAPLLVQDQETFLLAWPAAHATFSYLLDHPHPLIGRQWAEFSPGVDDFAAEIAPARTFTTLEETLYAREHGLLQGGSEENALVIYPDRFSAEPELPHPCARHKLLDLLGDLNVLGRPLQARVIAYQSGHRQNHRLAELIAAQGVPAGVDDCEEALG